MKSKNIVVVVRGGMVEEVFSNDKDVSITVIDVDSHKHEEGLSSKEVEKIISEQTKGFLTVKLLSDQF